VVFLPKSLAQLTTQLPVIQSLVRAAVRWLPIESQLNEPAESNPVVVMNINFSATSNTAEAMDDPDVADDCCTPWSGLEGYDSCESA
jgi:hypothetical protein